MLLTGKLVSKYFHIYYMCIFLRMLMYHSGFSAQVLKQQLFLGQHILNPEESKPHSLRDY